MAELEELRTLVKQLVLDVTKAQLHNLAMQRLLLKKGFVTEDEIAEESEKLSNEQREAILVLSANSQKPR